MTHVSNIGLHRYASFAGVLAAAGIPLYIHAPKFYVDQYGVSLTAIASALLGLRMLDFIQDPALGWIVDHLGKWRSTFASGMTVLLAGAMVALFAVPAPINPLMWFIVCLAVLFTAFSALSILFYSQGVAKGDTIGDNGHVRLASWRESGALIGVCLAAILPTIFLSFGIGVPMATFAIVFAACAVFGATMMLKEWRYRSHSASSSLRELISDPVLRQLLVIGLLNAAPAAVTSSLFLFFVEYRLGSAEGAGLLLLLFFLAAAASVPVCAKIARLKGSKWTLMASMLMAIVTFSFVTTLGQGDVWAFAIICVFSGAALGADMTLLPAMFSQRLKTVHCGGGQAFGLWNFCTKLTLAVAAISVLPALDYAGFSTQNVNPPQALFVLTFSYAVIPCILKIFALAVLYWTPVEETQYA